MPTQTYTGFVGTVQSSIGSIALMSYAREKIIENKRALDEDNWQSFWWNLFTFLSFHREKRKWFVKKQSLRQMSSRRSSVTAIMKPILGATKGIEIECWQPQGLEWERETLEWEQDQSKLTFFKCNSPGFEAVPLSFTFKWVWVIFFPFEWVWPEDVLGIEVASGGVADWDEEKRLLGGFRLSSQIRNVSSSKESWSK